MLIAQWSSRGSKWTALLYKQADGYRLSERKHGSEVGASYQPFSFLPDDRTAITHFNYKLMVSYDVEMRRVPL